MAGMASLSGIICCITISAGMSPIRSRRARPDRGAAQVAPYLDAGLTWWIEALGWWRGSPENAMHRVRQGPPTPTRHQP